jgi:hypothetical protein
MNTVIIRTPPPGTFEEISSEMPEWKEKFLSLVHQGKLIRYEAHTMPALTTDIRTELNKGNYCDFVLGRDSDRHFLVPRPG